MYLSKSALSSSTTEKTARKAASAVSFTGITGSRTLANIDGASRGIWGLTTSLCIRLTVRITTSAKRRASTGWPGCMIFASASKIDLLLSKPRLPCWVRRYLPAARMLLSDIEVFARLISVLCSPINLIQNSPCSRIFLCKALLVSRLGIPRSLRQVILRGPN